ncbi:MAG TPA: glycosyltransferase [Anaerolineales bacterium]|nr:glycosyltransferase [Anaerolineales bacterium]
MNSKPRIAFVIDALPALGGGEKVLFTALEVFPHAELFTLVYNKKLFDNTPLACHSVNTSFLDRLPFARKYHRLFLPAMPFAIEQFDLRGFDAIVSFSYAVAHGVISGDGARHISYTYTPMRYAWQELNINGLHTRQNLLIVRYMQAFRAWDRTAASRVHQFAAISQAVSRRIAHTYHRTAEVIYPPVEVSRFRPALERENFYITVTRLMPHKRIDLLVRAFAQLDLPLVVVGEGPERRHLIQLAGPNIRFLGYQPDDKVVELLAKARGFVCATEEDFGIAMVEAQAAGCPVIAYRQGGALETVVDGKTGIFFSEQTIESLVDALQRFERAHSSFHVPELVENAGKFDRKNFLIQFRDFVCKTI